MAGLYLPASTLRSWPGAGGERAGQCRQRQGLIVPGSQRAGHDSPWCVPASTLRSRPGSAGQRQRFDHGWALVVIVPGSVASVRA